MTLVTFIRNQNMDVNLLKANGYSNTAQSQFKELLRAHVHCYCVYMQHDFK